MPTLIRPRSQSAEVTEILNRFGAGIDRFAEAKRLAEDEERKRIRFERQKKGFDVLDEISTIEEQGTSNAPAPGTEGPPSPDVMEKRDQISLDTRDRLIAKYGRIKGKPETFESVSSKRKSLDALGLSDKEKAAFNLTGELPKPPRISLSGDMKPEEAKRHLASGEEFTKEQQTFLKEIAFPEESFASQFARGLVEAEKLKIMGEETKIKGALQKRATELKRDVGKTLNAFSLMWKKKKQQLDEGFKGGGVIGRGIKSVVGETLKPESLPATQEYQGQLVETALSQNRIITGSVRVIQSVFEKLLDSYPSKLDGERVAIGKIAQSARNTMGMAKSARDQGLQAEVKLIETKDPKSLDDPNSEINKKFSELLPSKLNLRDEIEVQKGLKRIFGPDYEKHKHVMVGNSDFGDVTNVEASQIDDIEELIKRAEEGDQQAEQAVKMFLPGIRF
jgi:hypothetical protein